MSIVAAGIKKLYYTDSSKITEDLTGPMVKTLIADAKEIKNVHGGTWTVEEEEATRTGYKNELTGQVYRETVELGEVTMNFTLGQYDFETKADLMGGDSTKGSWKRAKEVPNISKCTIAKTDDGVWVVFPKASISAREADNENAVGLAVVAKAMEHDNKDVSSEYWFTDEEVNKTSGGE